MEIVKIKEEHKKFLKPLIKQVNIARDGVSLAIEMHSRAQKELWETLKEEYPEIVGRRASFDHPDDKDWELILYGKDKPLPELFKDAARLDKRIKRLEDGMDVDTEEIVEKAVEKLSEELFSEPEPVMEEEETEPEDQVHEPEEEEEEPDLGPHPG